MEPPRSAKANKGPSAQEKRRLAALKRQKETRRGILGRARDLMVNGRHKKETEDGGNETGGVPQAIGQHGNKSGTTTTTAAGKSGWKEVSRADRVRERRRYWATQVTTPEWMVDVPDYDGNNGSGSGLNGEGSQVGEGWFVRARPEGKRCLVVAFGGSTTSRQLDGQLMHRWNSALPLGSPQTLKGGGRGGSGGGDEQPFVVLDCVFDEATKTYWVLDGMAWKDVSLYDSTAEFRFYWLHSKLSECAIECGDPGLRILPTGGGGGGGGQAPSSAMSTASAMPPPPQQPTAVGNAMTGASSASSASGFAGLGLGGNGGGNSSSSSFRIVLVPYYDCSYRGLEAAYSGPQPFIRDGLLFYLKQGFYECGPSPLVLQWKDAQSSRYLVWGDRQQAVLAVHDPVQAEEEQQQRLRKQKRVLTGGGAGSGDGVGVQQCEDTDGDDNDDDWSGGGGVGPALNGAAALADSDDGDAIRGGTIRLTVAAARGWQPRGGPSSSSSSSSSVSSSSSSAVAGVERVGIGMEDEHAGGGEGGREEGGGGSEGGGSEGVGGGTTGGDLSLVTLEGIVVGTMPRPFASANKVRCGDLLKFSIQGAFETVTAEVAGAAAAVPTMGHHHLIGEEAATTTTTTTTTTQCVLVDPQFDKRCSPSRALADSWSKLLFQCRARHNNGNNNNNNNNALQGGGGEGSGVEYQQHQRSVTIQDLVAACTQQSPASIPGANAAASATHSSSFQQQSPVEACAGGGFWTGGSQALAANAASGGV